LTPGAATWLLHIVVVLTLMTLGRVDEALIHVGVVAIVLCVSRYIK